MTRLRLLRPGLIFRRLGRRELYFLIGCPEQAFEWRHNDSGPTRGDRRPARVSLFVLQWRVWRHIMFAPRRNWTGPVAVGLINYPKPRRAEISWVVNLTRGPSRATEMLGPSVCGRAQGDIIRGRATFFAGTHGARCNELLDEAGPSGGAKQGAHQDSGNAPPARNALMRRARRPGPGRATRFAWCASRLRGG
jgi:hypothetical protein